MPKVETTGIEVWINSTLLPDFHRQMLVVQTEAMRKNKRHSVTELKTPVNGATIWLQSFNFSQLHFYLFCPAQLRRMQRASIKALLFGSGCTPSSNGKKMTHSCSVGKLILKETCFFFNFKRRHDRQVPHSEGYQLSCPIIRFPKKCILLKQTFSFHIRKSGITCCATSIRYLKRSIL